MSLRGARYPEALSPPAHHRLLPGLPRKFRRAATHRLCTARRFQVFMQHTEELPNAGMNEYLHTRLLDAAATQGKMDLGAPPRIMGVV